MGRPPQKSVDDKTRIVLAVLKGEITIAEAARREGTSQTSVATWRDQFLAGGKAALVEKSRHGPSTREQALEAEIEQLNTALGKRTWSSACGGKGGRSTRLRRPRGGPRERRHDHRAVLRAARHSPPDLVPVAGSVVEREGPLADAGPRCD